MVIFIYFFFVFYLKYSVSFDFKRDRRVHERPHKNAQVFPF
jgi:hypothetical protein